MSHNVYEKYYAPQIPCLVTSPEYNPLMISSIALTFTANDMYASRAVVPQGGTLKDMYVFIGGTAAGTGIGAIYDATALTPAAAASRPSLYIGTAVATTSTNTWTKLGDPNILVYAGQQLDLAVVLTNNTCTIGTYPSSAQAAIPDLPANFWPATEAGNAAGLLVGASNILTWKRASQASPASTQPDASITAVVNNVAIVCRVDPLY